MTRRLTSTLGMLAIAALLGGCASLSEEECRNADWGRLGHQDGAAGYPESRLAEHAEACAKIGIRPMGDIWRAGWDRGVLLYCVPSVGWREGLSGHGYSGVCRGRNDEARHRIRHRMRDLDSELNYLRMTLGTLQLHTPRY